jgi:organic hydroperoxide reductase OsmC/OhrA
MTFEVETRNVGGQVTAIGAAGPFTLTIDRPVEAGGGGLGFNGGQLLYLAVAACVSNDLFREASLHGIALDRVLVRVQGDFQGEPAVSTDIDYAVELSGRASADELRELVDHVDRIAEIPNSLRGGTRVHLAKASVVTLD